MAQQNHSKSPIWAHFSICNDDNLKAICKVCHERILSPSLLPHYLGYQMYRLRIQYRYSLKYR